jgi:hypothetical protein
MYRKIASCKSRSPSPPPIPDKEDKEDNKDEDLDGPPRKRRRTGDIMERPPWVWQEFSGYDYQEPIVATQEMSAFEPFKETSVPNEYEDKATHESVEEPNDPEKPTEVEEYANESDRSGELL